MNEQVQYSTKFLDMQVVVQNAEARSSPVAEVRIFYSPTFSLTSLKLCDFRSVIVRHKTLMINGLHLLV